VTVSFGDQSVDLSLEPYFEIGEFGTPGDYRAWFIPTRAGQYSFRFTGSIDGQDVDESFSSGPKTFDDVQSPSDAEFPVQDPTTGELAERIDREVPRLESAITGARTAVESAAASASDAASSAKTLAVVGVVLGAVGIVLGVVALAFGRRRA
jgi:hypothetical protein